MNTQITALGIALLMFAAGAPLQSFAAQNATTNSHTWTSLTGPQLTAEFIGIKDANLTLKAEGGELRMIPLSQLIPSDQALARKLDRARTGEPDAQTVGTSSDSFPVFLSGDAKGYHAVYSHPKFTAKVTKDGWIEIQCMENDVSVGPPIVFSFGHAYEDKKRKQYPRRRITEFKKMSQPTLSPRLLEYEAIIQSGATIGLNYAFIDNSIQIWGWVIDPPQSTDPTTMRLSFSFKPSHEFAPEILVTEQKKVLAPYTLIVQSKSGRTVRFPYADPVTGFPDAIQKVTVEGPLFGKRNVSVFAQLPLKSELSLYTYRNFAPFQGYSVRFMKQDLASTLATERMIITID